MFGSISRGLVRNGVAQAGCLLLLVSNLNASPGAEYNIKNWGVDEGLPQSSVTDISQTPDGYLWIGTLLSGLARFDGVRFVNFDPGNTPGLVHPGIRRLLVDATGTLWINDYANNLFRWRGDRVESVGAPPVRLGSIVFENERRIVFAGIEGELLIGHIRTGTNWVWEQVKPPTPGNPYYAGDSEGVLWFRAPNSRLGRLVPADAVAADAVAADVRRRTNSLQPGQVAADVRRRTTNSFEIWDNPPGLENRRVLNIARDRAMRIWVGTDDGLFFWDGTRFVNATPPGAAEPQVIRQIIAPQTGGMWVEVNGRFRLLVEGRWSQPVAQWMGTEAPWSRLRSIRSDNEGGMWISLREEGLAHIRADGSLHRLTGGEGLPSQLVQAMFVDREGNLWTGYHRGGLLQVRQRLFRPVAREQGLQDTVVTSITEDAAGAIWIGTAGGTVARWDGSACTNFALPLQGSFCQDVVVCGAPDGRVWIGTGGNGLLVFENGKFRHVIEPAALPGGVRLLKVQKNGQVWLSNFGGLFQLEDKKLRRVLGFGRTEEVAASLEEGPAGELWMGTIGGSLRRFQNGQWTDFRPSDGRPADRIWSLFPDTDGSVWAGTMNQGLLWFKDGDFTRYTTADGLPDNSISHILFEHEHFWFGSRAGILRAARAGFERRRAGNFNTMDCRVFGRGDGLLTVALTLEFQPNSLRSRDGRLWFGSANGASWVRPDEVGRRQPPPPVIIESISTDGKLHHVDAVSANATLALSPRHQALTLGPGIRHLEVHYTAPNFRAPELIQYRYQLEGVDTDWVPAGSRRSITYTRLPPGRFVFHVTAGNSDGVWNETGAAIELVVRPYLWQRKSFLAAIFIVGATSLAFSVRSLTRRRLQRRLEKVERLRALDRERARIAQDLHDDLGAALTEISLTSDLAQNETLAPEVSRAYVREIGGRARELVSAMDEIVWAVNPRNDSTASLVQYLCQYAQQQLKPTPIACRLNVDPGLPSVPLNSEQRHEVFLAFKEAIHNVLKHSQAREMRLAISAENGRLRIEISDDGRGFGADSTGEGADGLRNMPERLRRIGGSFEINSRPGWGTVVRMSVPMQSTELSPVERS